MPRKVFVTGGCGFVGSHLVTALLDDGNEVVVLSRDWHGSCGAYWGTNWRLHGVAGDLSSQAVLERIIAEYEIDTVVHLAAQTQMSTAIKEPIGTFEANVRGTWNLLEACRLQKVPRVVVASTDKVYGRAKPPYREDSPLLPDRPYESSKACADLLARTYASTYGMNIAVVRCVNIYGPGHLNFSTLVPGTIRRIFRGEQPMVRNGGAMSRDWVFVRDVAAAYTSLISGIGKGFTGAVNVGSGSPTSVSEIVKIISQLMGWEGGVRDEVDIHGEIEHQWSDASLAKRELGWSPAHSLQQGLGITVDWYKRCLEAMK